MEGPLRVLRWSALFPDFAPDCGAHKRRPTKAKALLWIFSLAVLLGNVLLLGFNVFLMNMFRVLFGMLHIETMTQILTGIKPLQIRKLYSVETTLNVLIFLCGIRQHRRLLDALSVTDRLFRENLACVAPYRAMYWVLLSVAGVSFGITFTLRLSQYILSGESPGEIFLADLSLLFVPALAVLQMLPLAYFVAINALVCHWYHRLNAALIQDLSLTQHRVDFYFSHYLKLCGTVAEIGSFFDPFIFVSLASSVVVLCLTIYFLINAQEALALPPGLPPNQIIVVIFQPIWAGIQIVTAALYAVAVTVTGIRTNETARLIQGPVLLLLPNDELSRFQILLFAQKVQHQFQWGITVWKAFPVERSLLITLISGILTYTVILIKLQQTARLEEANPDKLTALLNGTFLEA